MFERERRDIAEKYLPVAETYVYERDGVVVGFISLLGNEVGGLFVTPKCHGQGIGRALMDWARGTRDHLELDVFEANEIGRAFYEAYGFGIVGERFDEITGQSVLRLRLPSQTAHDLTLRTKRLRLRPLVPSDSVPLHELWTSRGVRQFLWDGEVIPSEQTLEVMHKNIELFEERGFGIWGAWNNDWSLLVGFGGFWYFRDPPDLELLFGVREELWGRGFATEIGEAVVNVAVDRLRWKRMQASTDAGNVASRHVLAKLGFRFMRRAVVGTLDTMFYERCGSLLPK